MEEEIEDIVGDVKLTDSQKSVATTNVYSVDFNDSSSSGKNNSSGKETYVIECDSDDSDKAYHLQNKPSVINLNGNPTKLCRSQDIKYKSRRANISVATSLQKCSFVSQEIFTQTSKTIFELADKENKANLKANTITMETQTSVMSIIENKTIERRIQVHGSIKEKDTADEVIILSNDNGTSRPVGRNSVIIESLELPQSDTEDQSVNDNVSKIYSNSDLLHLVDTVSKENLINENMKEALYENSSEYEDTSRFDSDFEADSLVGDEPRVHFKSDNLDAQSDISVTKSVDRDVEDLYTKISQSMDLRCLDRPDDYEMRICNTLSPLTEESIVKKESFIDITPDDQTGFKRSERYETDFRFENNAGIRVRMLENEAETSEPFKLPPIHRNQSCPNSPHLNFLFSGSGSDKLCKAGTLPCLLETQREKSVDRWEIGNKELASGESANINGSAMRHAGQNLLPPIFVEGNVIFTDATTDSTSKSVKTSTVSSDSPHESICIQDKIKDLKMSSINTKCRKTRTRNYSKAPESRSVSPGSTTSPDDSRLCDAAEKGCEALCVEVIRKLRSQSWFEAVETLEELPTAFEKFWSVITEQRIADIIRQVCVHIDSPRTQVARTACNTLATVLKNTNYTKKPDFYEAVTTLLVKTGSFSKPVRRAANVALDDIVCGVETSHAVTALCLHGVGHKSALVRCAAARLLVVSTALAGGGRDLLRARPPTAAGARRHALRALAALLDDKSIDTRKYAERLYSMLRPQTNFEAYYLTDVDVELASRQMKKYDQLLLCGPSKDTR